MRKRGPKALDSQTFKRIMEKVCPADAEQDAEMQRLLARMGGDPEKDQKR